MSEKEKKEGLALTWETAKSDWEAYLKGSRN